MFFFTSHPIIILPPILLFLCFLISLHTCCLWHTCFPWEKKVKLEWRAQAWCGRRRGGDRLSLFYTRPPRGSSSGFKDEVYPPTGQHWRRIKLKGVVVNVFKWQIPQRHQDAVRCWLLEYSSHCHPLFSYVNLRSLNLQLVDICTNDIFNWEQTYKVSKPPVASSYFWLIGMTSTLVCISGPSTGCGALMRGKFVLAKHGQIYEPATLSSTALTTDINIKTLQGGLYHMANWDPPNMVVYEGAVS